MWLRWLGALIAGTVMDALGLIAVPIALLFVRNDPDEDAADHLPRLAWPWDNHEARYGIDGGYAWMRQYDTSALTYWRRFIWLAIRNPSHNFAYYILGRKASVCYQGCQQEIDWQEIEDHGGAAVFIVNEVRKKGWRKWPQVFVHNRLVYIRIGWQWNDSTDPDARCRFSCVIRKGHIKAA